MIQEKHSSGFRKTYKQLTDEDDEQFLTLAYYLVHVLVYYKELRRSGDIYIQSALIDADPRFKDAESFYEIYSDSNVKNNPERVVSQTVERLVAYYTGDEDVQVCYRKVADWIFHSVKEAWRATEEKRTTLRWVVNSGHENPT